MRCKKCDVELLNGSVFCHACGKKQIEPKKKYIKRANGTGTVYRLSGKRRRPWIAAKGRVVIGYYEKKGEALDALNALVGKDITERYNMTFKEVYEAWKTEHFRGLTDNGIEGYETAYKHFESLFNETFRAIRTSDYQKIVDALADKGRKRPTMEKVKQLASQMSKWAVREEIISTNFAQFIKLPEAEKAEKDIFTAADIRKLKESRDDAAKLVIILVYTGMRIGELFSLETERVFKNYCIGGEKSEAGRDRIIPIPAECRSEMAYFRSRAEGKPLLIDGYDGNRSVENFRKRDYYPLLETLGIEKKPPHSTRHTYASMAVTAGIKPEILQKILGHADYSTTANIYVHADIDALVKAAEKIGYQHVTNKVQNREKAKTP